MTPAEALAREAIRATLAACAQAGDSLRGEEYAACFTEQGTLTTHSPAGDGLDLHGRAAILAWQTGLRQPGKGIGAASAVPLKFARHNLTTCKIELSGPQGEPDRASVRTYWFVVTNAGPDHAGVYRDRFERVGDDWLIAERQVKTEWAAETSLMVPPESRPR